ncbi:MAG: BtaA family protein [Gemmatimonadota bacterium]|nr:MAG: BtaA family protein [Gemmatimonadota bacterium]
MSTATAPTISSATAFSSAAKPEILERPVFARLLFTQCWEDPRMDYEALQVQPHHTLLSVTSGGCNTLSLAALAPARVIAVDLNPTQSWLLELKIAGIRRLTHGEYLELLGVRDSRSRWELYHAVRDELTSDARAYWDTQRSAIESGLLGAGRYERYLAAFRRLLHLIEGRSNIKRLLACQSLDEQHRFYEETWDSFLWRLFFRVFFSRTVLGLGGLDPRFFTYVNGMDSFGQHFRRLTRHALVDLPVPDNYFVAQIALGRYLDERAMPPYLLAENFETLRQMVDRIEIVTDELGAVLKSLPSNSVDAFNFSNVFEWVPPETFEAMLRETHRVARPGARLCYRNLLVRREHLPSLDHLFTPHDKLAARLLYHDRSFVYSNFEVASVKKPAHERES